MTIMPWNELSQVDVLVAGGGNAGLCAALAAREAGASVVVVDYAPSEYKGGSSAYATGTVRSTYTGVNELRALVPDLSDEEARDVDFGSYTVDDFYQDLSRLSNYRADPDLADMVSSESLSGLTWLVGHGVRFVPTYGTQSFVVGGRRRFWGGVAVEAVGGGTQLVDTLTRAALNRGVRIAYGKRAVGLIERDGAVSGAKIVDEDGKCHRVAASAVVLACGGFDANTEWRARYLGSGWDLARVRGSEFSVGDGIRMALEVGAEPYGHWSGCHAVAWDANAPALGDRAVGTGFSRHSYPYGVMVNQRGERFVDEGADFRTYTYGIYGGEILRQPNQLAWQIFDQEGVGLLRPEYSRVTTKRVVAESIDDLAVKTGIDAQGLSRTITEFNAAVLDHKPFDPTIRDGRTTAGLRLKKSNWAMRIERPPFEAYEVTCGVSFTYGGLHIGSDGAVMTPTRTRVKGLFAAGSVVGGLCYGNCASGTSLTAGVVTGRHAGYGAAKFSITR